MATQEEKDKLFNLAGKNVSTTYNRLLQKTSEHRIVDGDGNAPSTLVFGGDIIVSGSITAESSTYIVSESIIHQSTLEGSTKFGDTSDDTHQFTGSIHAFDSELSVDKLYLNNQSGSIVWPHALNSQGGILSNNDVVMFIKNY